MVTLIGELYHSLSRKGMIAIVVADQGNTEVFLNASLRVSSFLTFSILLLVVIVDRLVLLQEADLEAVHVLIEPPPPLLLLLFAHLIYH